MRILRMRSGGPLTVLSMLIIAALISGCAASKPEVPSAAASVQLSRPVSRYPLAPLPEDPVLEKPLPEMTAADYEASGDLHWRNQDLAMAFVQYEKSLALDPANPRIHYKEGLLFLNTGKNDEAAKAFRKVLEKVPDDAGAHEGLGMVCYEINNYAEAEKHLLAALSIEPSLWKSRVYLARIYDAQGKYNQAERAYRQAIQSKPDDAMLYNNLGVSLYLAGRYEKSIQIFQEALGLEGPKARVYNNLGLAYGKIGRYDASLDAFLRASDRATAYNNMGCVYLSRGAYLSASEAFKKAIELSPKFYTTAYENLKIIPLETTSK